MSSFVRSHNGVAMKLKSEEKIAESFAICQLNGATTLSTTAFSIMTLSTMTLSIKEKKIRTLSIIPLSIMDDHCYDECC